MIYLTDWEKSFYPFTVLVYGSWFARSSNKQAKYYHLLSNVPLEQCIVNLQREDSSSLLCKLELNKEKKYWILVNVGEKEEE